jgi:ubiquinone/menaquinone biosynthesis C-methylase UbiE
VSNSDLFGDRADDYARSRPTYPEALFTLLERLAPARDLAWDCGTGSGQTARSLARGFERVLATDSSVRQLAHVPRNERIHLAAAIAEAAPIRDRSVDLVTVSTAIHWFDRPRFYAEVRRIARPGAVLAVWSYFHSRISPEIDRVLERYADEVVAPHWDSRFDLNRHRYRDLDFPFERLPWPELHAEARMRLADLCQYMGTWSASVAFQRERGTDPVDVVRGDLERAWGDPKVERVIRWKLHGAIGRIP